MSYEFFKERIENYKEQMKKNDTISKAKAIEEIMRDCTRYMFPTIQQGDGFEEYVKLHSVLRVLRDIEGVNDELQEDDERC